MLTNYRCRNLGPLSEVDLDLAALGPGLIACYGANGTGKTTWMGSTGPSLWFPKKSVFYETNLFDHFGEGEAFVEATHDEVTYRLQTNGRSKEAFVSGPGINAGPLMRDYDAAVKALVPDRDEMLATTFGVQSGTGSLMTVGAEARRTMFASFLAVERYKTWAQEAEKRRQATAAGSASLQQALEDARAKLAGRGELQEKLRLAEDKKRGLDGIKDFLQKCAEESEADLRAAEQNHAVKKERYDALTRERGGIVIKKETISGEIQSITSAIEEIEKESAEAVEDPETKIRELDELIATTGETLASAKAERERLQGERNACQASLDAVTAKLGELDSQIHEIETSVEGKRQAHEAAERHLGPQTESLALINLDLEMCRQCPLTQAAQPALETRTQAREAFERAQADAEPLLAMFRQERESLLPEQESAAEALVQADARLEEACGLVQKAEEYMEELRGQHSVASKALQKHMERLKRRSEFAEKRGKLESLRSSEAAMKADMDRLAEEIGQIDLPAAGKLDELRRQYDQAKAAWEKWQGDLRSVEDSIRDLNGEMKAMEGAVTDMEKLERQCQAYLADGEDLKLVAKACQEVRMSVIAQALPAVTEIATELLSGFDGGKWRVKFQTLAEKKSGDGLMEAFDILAVNTQTGKELRKVSGGETVVIDEAIRTGIAAYRRESTGIQVDVAWRDECAGGLDEQHAAKYYVSLLRQMLKLTGASQCFFAAHNQLVWGEADHVLEFRDGTIIPTQPHLVLAAT